MSSRYAAHQVSQFALLPRYPDCVRMVCAQHMARCSAGNRLYADQRFDPTTPAKAAPSSASTTAPLRRRSIQNPASSAVTTVHGQARRWSCRQPVSSIFTTGACCTAARASATMGARAALWACSWRTTAPGDTRDRPQVLQQLPHVPPAHPIPATQQRYHGGQPPSERAAGHARRETGASPSAAGRTAPHPHLVLGHPHGQGQQLYHLMPPCPTPAWRFGAGEGRLTMPTALRHHRHDLVHLLNRQQPAAGPRCPG
jgi:hypothetical protein